MCDINPSKEEIDNFINKRLKNAGDDKIAIILVGGPGSGKSTGKYKIIKELNKNHEDFVNIDPDEIISQLFNNNNKCREEVNQINNKSYEEAISAQKNIIFDGTGKDFEWYHSNVIKRLKDLDYYVNLVIVMNKVDIVMKRIKNRAQISGRNVSENYTNYVYKALSEAIPKYLSLDCYNVDSIYLFDNSKEEIQLVYKTMCDDSFIKKMFGGNLRFKKGKNLKQKKTNKKITTKNSKNNSKKNIKKNIKKKNIKKNSKKKTSKK